MDLRHQRKDPTRKQNSPTKVDPAYIPKNEQIVNEPSDVQAVTPNQKSLSSPGRLSLVEVTPPSLKPSLKPCSLY